MAMELLRQQQQPLAHIVAMDAVGEETAAELSSCRHRELSNGGVGVREGCRPLEVEMEVMESKAGPSQGREGESLASEAAAPGGDGANLPFSKELIRFSLYGKVPDKLSEFCMSCTYMHSMDMLACLLLLLICCRASPEGVFELTDSRSGASLQKYPSDAILLSLFSCLRWHWSVCCRISS